MGAGRVAARVFDLDDVGAPVAEQHGGDRRGVNGAKVEHPQTGQRAVRLYGGGGCFGIGGGLGIGRCGGGRHVGSFSSVSQLHGRFQLG
jgi:hypothetical protein